MRSHPYTCTGCGHGFDAFKQLRKHWNGSCTACQLQASSTSSASPPLIDPSRNLWLHDDDLHDDDLHDDDLLLLDDDDNTEYNTDDYSNDTDTDDVITILDDDDVITILDNDHLQTILEPDEPLQVHTTAPAHEQENNDVRKELLFELFHIVEMLSEKVLKLERPPDRPAPTTSAKQSDQQSAQQSPPERESPWITVPGNQKQRHISSQQRPIELRNRYESLPIQQRSSHSQPSPNPQPPTSTQTLQKKKPGRPLSSSTTIQKRRVRPGREQCLETTRIQMLYVKGRRLLSSLTVSATGCRSMNSEKHCSAISTRSHSRAQHQLISMSHTCYQR